MRTAFLALSLLFAVVASCSVESPPSEATQPDELASADPAARVCPQICGLGTLCLHANGTCGEVCNPCFCKASGGTVVSSCPAAAEATTPVDDTLIGGGGGVCGDKVCGRGSFCCNASCGICAPRGGVCTQQICNPVE
jgi:hypothetical protein